MAKTHTNTKNKTSPRKAVNLKGLRIWWSFGHLDPISMQLLSLLEFQLRVASSQPARISNHRIESADSLAAWMPKTPPKRKYTPDPRTSWFFMVYWTTWGLQLKGIAGVQAGAVANLEDPWRKDRERRKKSLETLGGLKWNQKEKTYVQVMHEYIQDHVHDLIFPKPQINKTPWHSRLYLLVCTSHRMP